MAQLTCIAQAWYTFGQCSCASVHEVAAGHGLHQGCHEFSIGLIGLYWINHGNAVYLGDDKFGRVQSYQITSMAQSNCFNSFEWTVLALRYDSTCPKISSPR